MKSWLKDIYNFIKEKSHFTINEMVKTKKIILNKKMFDLE